MASLVTFSVDDNDLEDAALWAVIDSAVASHSSSKSRNPLPLKNSNPNPIQNPSPQPPSSFKIPINRNFAENNVVDLVEGEVLQEPWEHHRPQKMARYCVSEVSETSPLAVVKHVQLSPATLAYPSSHVQRSPTMPAYSSPPMYSSPSDTGRFCVKELTPVSERAPMNCRRDNENGVMRHSLSGSFPSVSLFKQYQNAAMAILEKPDYTMISGNPYIKKSGWRKISFYFNLSYEIKDKTIEFDENRNVQRAEFVVRAHMQGGRYSDGWGSCERREKRFSKPNHDIPSTAETRAKNKACQDLLGIGEYRPGAKA